MEAPKPEPVPDEETTAGGWEHEPSLLSRTAHRIGDAFRIRGWAELPADPNGRRLGEKPVAAIVEYPHDLELCDPPELGWQRRT